MALVDQRGDCDWLAATGSRREAFAAHATAGRFGLRRFGEHRNQRAAFRNPVPRARLRFAADQVEYRIDLGHEVLESRLAIIDHVIGTGERTNSAPGWELVPTVVQAMLATIIASQAVVSGAFSMTSLTIELDFLPRLRIV